jgi:hypothetical protein
MVDSTRPGLAARRMIRSYGRSRRRPRRRRGRRRSTTAPKRRMNRCGDTCVGWLLRPGTARPRCLDGQRAARRAGAADALARCSRSASVRRAGRGVASRAPGVLDQRRGERVVDGHERLAVCGARRIQRASIRSLTSAFVSRACTGPTIASATQVWSAGVLAARSRRHEPDFTPRGCARLLGRAASMGAARGGRYAPLVRGTRAGSQRSRRTVWSVLRGRSPSLAVITGA